MTDRTTSAFARLERELQQERVAALVRISARLGQLVELVWGARAELDAATGPDCEARLARYRALHAEACKYRWYLEVQRESIGLRQHGVLDRLFPMPGER